MILPGDLPAAPADTRGFIAGLTVVILDVLQRCPQCIAQLVPPVILTDVGDEIGGQLRIGLPGIVLSAHHGGEQVSNRKFVTSLSETGNLFPQGFHRVFDPQLPVLHPFGVLINCSLAVVFIADVLPYPALGVEKLLEHG